MAKKKAKKKSKRASATAQWNGARVFSFDGADNGEFVQNAPNSFKLVPVGFDEEPHPLVYQLQSTGSPGVTPFWRDVKLIWVPGKQLKMGFHKYTGSNEPAERLKRYRKTGKKVAKPADRIKYERLTGLSKLADGTDAVITLFLAEKNFTDGIKGILVAAVDQQTAAPGGLVVGNG